MEKFRPANKILSIIIILMSVSLTSFSAFTASSALSQYDMNGDGIVNVSDLTDMSNHMGEKGTPGWIKEDVDKNGIIDVCDMMLVANHYGESVTSVTTNNVAQIKKLSIAYSGAMTSSANQEFIASHFDLLDCPRTYQTAVANVKTLNPKITVLGYYDACLMSSSYDDWTTVNQHEDWFLHDINGNRVRPSAYSNEYVMNPNSGWSTYYAQQCKQFLSNYPQYSGIFSDDVMTDINAIGFQFTVSYSKLPSNVLPNWGTWTHQLIQTTQTAIGTHMLMPNAWIYPQYCQDITHVHFWEGFIHSSNYAYNDNDFNVENILSAIDLLHTQAKLGNIIAVNSGCANADSHTVQAKAWMMFCYACFAFATVDVTKAYFSWQFFSDDSSHGWYPEMDIVLGQPVADYYKITNPYVYAREFANYYVVANLNSLGTGAVTFTLNGVSHTLSPSTAVLIQK